MNIHKNARLTLARRMELVKDIIEGRLATCAAVAAYGVSLPTTPKWVGRYLAEGEAGLFDRSSRPRLSLRVISPVKALAIVELCRRRLIQARIAAAWVYPRAPWDASWLELACPALEIWSPPSRCFATNMLIPEI